MYSIKNFVAIILLGAFASCSPNDNPKNDFFKWAQKGKIIDKVICKDDQSLSYCLYLPSNYDINHYWPVIYCFDPKGDGKLPVTLFKNIAEKRGYVLIGSNDSKNGTDPGYLSQIMAILFADTKAKLCIDEKRIYTAGFSGGARVACACALTFKNVSGVIACSAGYQPSDGQSNFNFIGMAGDSDMNYLEMKVLDSTLEKLLQPHQFFVFEGKHHWPPKHVLEEAIYAFDLDAMKKQVIPTDKEFIKKFIESKSMAFGKLEKCDSNDSLYKAFVMAKNAQASLAGLVDVSGISGLIAKINVKPEFQTYLKLQSLTELTEKKEQQLHLASFQKENLNWWQQETDKLKTISTLGKTKIERLSAVRSLAFISLVSYSYVSSSIAQNNWGVAKNFCAIYGLADPENPDYHYFKACILVNEGKMNNAIDELKLSIKFGFSDKQKLLADGKLLMLHDYPKFEEVKNLLK